MSAYTTAITSNKDRKWSDQQKQILTNLIIRKVATGDGDAASTHV